jgi:hypothetical protein
MVFQLLRGFTAWSFVALAIVQVWRMFTVGLVQARRMHQVPCSNCRYFSGDYTLKCTLHPHNACTFAAIGCHDYER